MKTHPTPEQLYALERAARRARSAELGRLAQQGGRALAAAINRVAHALLPKGPHHA